MTLPCFGQNPSGKVGKSLASRLQFRNRIDSASTSPGDGPGPQPCALRCHPQLAGLSSGLAKVEEQSPGLSDLPALRVLGDQTGREATGRHS